MVVVQSGNGTQYFPLKLKVTKGFDLGPLFYFIGPARQHLRKKGWHKGSEVKLLFLTSQNNKITHMINR